MIFSISDFRVSIFIFLLRCALLLLLFLNLRNNLASVTFSFIFFMLYSQGLKVWRGGVIWWVEVVFSGWILDCRVV